MRILSLTAGAAEMYCGSCLRDNALARELMAMGHDVILAPVYTPTKVDGRNVSGSRVLFGGISVYLQQHSALFRHTPWIVDRLLDSPWALKMASRRSLAVNPKLLGEMTVSMLEGESGRLAKEFAKLEYWFSQGLKPDVVNLPNTLLISMAQPVRNVFRGPLVCTMQGEDLFLDSLAEPYRSQALSLIRARVKDIDAFVAVSAWYADYMAEYFQIPRARIHTVGLGVDPAASSDSLERKGDFTVSYMARIAPEKGLHLLFEAWRRFREKDQGPARLRAAGYLAPEHRPYLEGVTRQLTEWGHARDFEYLGELDHGNKARFLAEAHVLTVPVVYDDPKGLYALEALAAGTPVVLPARGALTEHVERTGGGILTAAGDARQIADAWLQLKNDPSTARQFGERGRANAALHYSVRAMASQTLELYRMLAASPPPSAMGETVASGQ
ncbi:MAG: glycosyltransferase [Bryobacterales bacterium]|nr:glycosyltransferase [Bryobacterales bacterium]